MFMRIVAAIVAVIALGMPQGARAELLVKIDKSTQQMTVSLAGETKHVWPVSTGRAGFGTPTGQFRPQWMARRWFSRKYYNSPMPHSIFFHRGYAIHGTTEIRRLGGPASHGCVRLKPENAAALFALVTAQGMKNTRIEVTGSNPPTAVAKAKGTKPATTVSAGSAPKGAAKLRAAKVQAAKVQAAKTRNAAAARTARDRPQRTRLAPHRARPVASATAQASQRPTRSATVAARSAVRTAPTAASRREPRRLARAAAPTRVASPAPMVRSGTAPAPHQVYYYHSARGTEIRYWSR